MKKKKIQVILLIIFLTLLIIVIFIILNTREQALTSMKKLGFCNSLENDKTAKTQCQNQFNKVFFGNRPLVNKCLSLGGAKTKEGLDCIHKIICSMTEEQFKCTDSDRSKNYFVAGSASYTRDCDHINQTLYDFCSGNILYEAYCESDDTHTNEIYGCKNGCSEGKCNP